ncbi:MAG: pyridoxal-phosphate dependent enzyme [Nocardiopsaceae bacterium]|nr:pyridoxal-phosphate dependent enzyme [Nocardiopsaceae bacterium]
MDLSLERIEEAARLIDPPLLNTPQISDPMLTEALGCDVVLKMENLSPIGSFKGRGADYFVGGLQSRDDRLVTATSGNWGSGLAYAGRRHGNSVDIFADTSARPGKLARMRALGANVTVVAGGPEEVHAAAHGLAETQPGCRLVSDGEPAAVAEGHGTIGMELSRAGTLDAVVVQIGDGALMSGIACWLKAQSPNTRVVGVCASGAPAMKLSIDAGRPVRKEPATIAGGLAIAEPIPASLERISALVDDIVLVDDNDIRVAMALIADTIGVLVEPSGAAGVAAVQRHQVPGERIAVLLTGAFGRPDWTATLS